MSQEGIKKDADVPKGSRPWTPNRQRNVRSKKSFDQKKMSHLVEDDKSVYKGELDPRKKEQRIKSKPRSISRSEEKVRAKAKALAANDPIVLASLRKKDGYSDFRDEYSKCKASPGRLGALFATQQVRKRHGYAQEVIESTIDCSHLEQQDRAFATLLTLGVVSTQGSLDQVIDHCLSSPSDIKADVRDALRLSAYEIIYLRKTPHAAVDQGVELVRAVAPSAAGLGNAVLHRILKSAESFPFADPSKDINALALLYGFPVWLAKLLIQDMGAEAAITFMKASNEPAPLFIGVNALKTTNQDIFTAFEEVGCPLDIASAGGITPPGCYRVPQGRILTDGRIKRLFSKGEILVSDAAAQAVVACVLEGDMPQELLEVGAGRGTKTILIQSDAQRKFNQQLNLTSMDSHGFKTDLLQKRAKEYGVQISDVVTGNATRLDSVMSERSFDRIFIDAPCSGLGTLRRHHDIRWRITPEQIEELVATNLSLLKSAANHVKVGGSLIYSTCTVTYAENNGCVKAFLESEEGKNFRLAPINGKACFASKLTPGSPDAHFAAKFTRVS